MEARHGFRWWQPRCIAEAVHNGIPYRHLGIDGQRSCKGRQSVEQSHHPDQLPSLSSPAIFRLLFAVSRHNILLSIFYLEQIFNLL
jgi:hypothetical protein